MASAFIKQTALPSPPERAPEAIVEVFALQAGHLTLPERFFVHPASPTTRRTVPSLAFLIEHQEEDTKKKTRILFDLGLRRDPQRYPEPIQNHIATRQPLTTDPDVVKSLAAGGLGPDDIDFVLYSHVHWDHVGEPRDFPTSTFVVGYGARDLLQGQSVSLRGSHSFFEADLLPEERTVQLPSPYEVDEHLADQPNKPTLPDLQQPWISYGNLPRVIDWFHDGSILIVDAPGHLPGHINLLIKTGPLTRVYLGGDACHDRRIIRKQKEIGEWYDADGHLCCIHADRKLAEQTIERIQELERNGVEVIFAHDVEWEEDPRNKSRFWGQERPSTVS